ncbi:hypothetical protein PIB30_001659 [Stylosanthes scabra]|uniref:Uncharacterized protein n=1 Tax=Stylosanthes scabra TaxID=79078 RepID=A0ABU6T2I7_9FABA|nr:hypothetical protein [Stylosanthes scabra]
MVAYYGIKRGGWMKGFFTGPNGIFIWVLNSFAREILYPQPPVSFGIGPNDEVYIVSSGLVMAQAWEPFIQSNLSLEDTSGVVTGVVGMGGHVVMETFKTGQSSHYVRDFIAVRCSDGFNVVGSGFLLGLPGYSTLPVLNATNILVNGSSVPSAMVDAHVDASSLHLLADEAINDVVGDDIGSVVAPRIPVSNTRVASPGNRGSLPDDHLGVSSANAPRAKELDFLVIDLNDTDDDNISKKVVDNVLIGMNEANSPDNVDAAIALGGIVGVGAEHMYEPIVEEPLDGPDHGPFLGPAEDPLPDEHADVLTANAVPEF